MTKYKGKWEGQLKYKGENILVGYFDTEEAATESVDSLREELIMEDEVQTEYERELMFFREQVQGLHLNV